MHACYVAVTGVYSGERKVSSLFGCCIFCLRHRYKSPLHGGGNFSGGEVVTSTALGTTFVETVYDMMEK
jgi:hypothetical protein